MTAREIADRYSLSARQTEVLSVLMDEPGRVYSARYIEDRVYADAVSYGRAAQHIMGIRRRIGRDCITTVAGRGWKWVGA